MRNFHFFGRIIELQEDACWRRCMHASAKRQLSRGEDVKFISLQHIPLASAYLCPNCSSIGNSSKQCPACASPFLLSVAGVLDRAPQLDSAPQNDAQLAYERVHAIAA
jgi:hypothetical protein